MSKRLFETVCRCLVFGSVIAVIFTASSGLARDFGLHAGETLDIGGGDTVSCEGSASHTGCYCIGDARKAILYKNSDDSVLYTWCPGGPPDWDRCSVYTRPIDSALVACEYSSHRIPACR